MDQHLQLLADEAVTRREYVKHSSPAGPLPCFNRWCHAQISAHPAAHPNLFPCPPLTHEQVDQPQQVQDGTVPGIRNAAVRKLQHELGIAPSQV